MLCCWVGGVPPPPLPRPHAGQRLQWCEWWRQGRSLPVFDREGNDALAGLGCGTVVAVHPRPASLMAWVGMGRREGKGGRRGGGERVRRRGRDLRERRWGRVSRTGWYPSPPLSFRSQFFGGSQTFLRGAFGGGDDTDTNMDAEQTQKLKRNMSHNALTHSRTHALQTHSKIQAQPHRRPPTRRK